MSISRNFVRQIQSAAAITPRIKHLPVFASEVSSTLKPKDGQVFLDMTFGGGGHTKHLLSINTNIHVIALDRDPEAYRRAIELSKVTNNRVVPMLGKFSDAPDLLLKLGVKKGELNGIIMDLGASSFQMETAARGFGLARDGPLDMRMDRESSTNTPTAADVVNSLDSDALAKIFKTYGDEKHAKKIAQAIVDSRFMMRSIKTTKQLAQLISSIVDNEDRFDALGRPSSAATKVFQALRIFVNNELNELDYALDKMRDFLFLDPNVVQFDPKEKDIQDANLAGGILAAISFHSIEDTIIKSHFGAASFGDDTNPYKQRPWNAMEVATPDEIAQVRTRKWLPLKKFVLFPSEVEILTNPKSRSAKLRCAMRAI